MESWVHLVQVTVLIKTMVPGMWFTHGPPLPHVFTLSVDNVDYSDDVSGTRARSLQTFVP